MCCTPQKLARLAHYSNDVATEATPTSVDAQTIFLPPTTAAPSGGDSRAARTDTAHSLSYSPHKFPRLTGLSNDFTHARAAAAATTAAVAQSSIIIAQQSPFRLLGNGDEVFSAATPISAAAQAIAPLTTAAVPPGGNTYTLASTLAALPTEAAASSAGEAGAGACLATPPTKKKVRARGGKDIPGHQRKRVLAARREQAK